MRYQDQQLLTIFEIAKILVGGHDLEGMLDRLLPSLVETLEAADAGSLWLCDPVDGQLTVAGAYGYDAAYLKQIRLAPGEAIAGRVFQTGLPELHSNPEAAARALLDMAPANRDNFVKATIGLAEPLSAVSVPLSTGPQRIGALTLLNLRQAGGFDDADLAFLLRVADLISLAIENARLREELQATQALSDANRLKAEVIGILAHEMRTPLTSIKGYSTALLMDDVTFSASTQREFLQMIDEECDVLQNLIHDLLESSIIDAGLLRLELQPVRLPRLVATVTDDVGRHTQLHRFLLDFPGDFPIVDADPDRVAQVLRNLLDNAVKYSPQGGLIVIRGEVRSGEVVISVADQGLGIAPEHLNRLFEKFFRAKSPLGRHVVGSGLGLPISRTVVETHGGQIWAESELGHGSTFFFTLPRRRPDQAEPDYEARTNE